LIRQQKEYAMSIGKQIRMKRIFAHPSGRLCSIAVDHFIGYGEGLPERLRTIQPTLAAIVAARPDAVTMHKGVAMSAWGPYAGQIPFILQSTLARVDDSACEQIATPEDAIRLGADAIAVAAFVHGSTEAAHLRAVADCVREAARYDLPVILHIYPRVFTPAPAVSFAPEDIAWAVRCGVETGVDVVKTPYCGDVLAHAQIVKDSPVPVVAAGGPRAQTLESALQMMSEVIQSGALGATIGRNVWGFPEIGKAVTAFKAVIHDRKSAQEAMQLAGLA
jgi:fructose-bisphosphate aldolase, class I